MKMLALTIAAAAALFAARPATDTAVPPGDNTWKIDPVHSSVVFKVKHANASWFYGTFTGISGSLTLDADKPENGKVEVKIDAASIASRDDKRDQHLRSPDFFDAKQFPDITFTSAKIKKTGDALQVDGELKMRGEKKPLSLKVSKTGDGEFQGKRVGYETTFVVKRSDFGMNYGIAKNVLGDEVTVMIGIEAMLDAKPGPGK